MDTHFDISQVDKFKKERMNRTANIILIVCIAVIVLSSAVRKAGDYIVGRQEVEITR